MEGDIIGRGEKGYSLSPSSQEGVKMGIK